MPARIPVEGQILQHQHRITGRYLGEQDFQTRRQRVDQQIMVARGRHQLNLQAAVATGKKHPILEQPRRGTHTTLVEHGRQCGRTTLVLGLGEERHLAELDPLRQQLGL
ncbi:hypothetical protein D3C78_939740 [compost metagenome]